MSEFNTSKPDTRTDPLEGSALEDGVRLDFQPLYVSEGRAPQGEAQRVGATGQTWERPPSTDMLKRNEIGQAAVNVTVMREALLQQKEFRQDNFELAG